MIQHLSGVSQVLLTEHWHLLKVLISNTARCQRWGTRTGDDIYQFVRDGGLTTTVVFHLKGLDHFSGIFRRVIHSTTTEISISN